MTEEYVFRPGLYRHYKGGLYTALCLVAHHETRLPMVLYVSHTYGGTNVRPLRGWDQDTRLGGSGCVDEDGWLDEIVVKGGTVPRFQFVKELPQDEPLPSRMP